MTEQNINLLYPVTDETNTEVKELQIRRPKVKDMLLADRMKGKSEAEKEIALFASLCSIAPQTIEKLDMADYQSLQKAYQDFLS